MQKASLPQDTERKRPGRKSLTYPRNIKKHENEASETADGLRRLDKFIVKAVFKSALAL